MEAILKLSASSAKLGWHKTRFSIRPRVISVLGLPLWPDAVIQWCAHRCNNIGRLSALEHPRDPRCLPCSTQSLPGICCHWLAFRVPSNRCDVALSLWDCRGLLSLAFVASSNPGCRPKLLTRFTPPPAGHSCDRSRRQISHDGVCDTVCPPSRFRNASACGKSDTMVVALSGVQSTPLISARLFLVGSGLHSCLQLRAPIGWGDDCRRSHCIWARKVCSGIRAGIPCRRSTRRLP